MLGKAPRSVYKSYFGAMKYAQSYPDEASCERKVLELKYPRGFECKKCGNDKYYRLHGSQYKRNRLLECSKCKKQESLTKNTVFEGSKVSLHQWFWAIFFITQGKKGISGIQLSKHIGVSESTARLMLYKLRKEMEESPVKYQIGGPDKVVEMDEFEIGGVGSEDKQNSLILLEKQKTGHLGRVRFAPMTDETAKSLELNAIPQIASGSTLHTDGKNTYKKLAQKYFKKVKLAQVAHWEENHSHTFLSDLNTIVGNFKTWYRGTHHSFALANSAYYMNEFAYRFNRRRDETCIFDRLLGRSVGRAKKLKKRELFSGTQYLPIAA